MNHTLPSGPATIAAGWFVSVKPTAKFDTTPSGVIRATLPPFVNHTLPSAPATIPPGHEMPGSV